MRAGSDSTYILYRVSWVDDDGSQNEGYTAAKRRQDVQERLSYYNNVVIENIGTVDVCPF